MVFSGITFLYYFLPAVLCGYFLMPRNWKNGWLLVSSLLFYAWGEPKYILLLAGAVVIFYLLGLAIEKLPGRKLWLWLAVLAGAGMLGILKYWDFVAENLNTLFGAGLPLLRLAMPLGISFYTFQCISYAVDVYRQQVPAQKSLLRFGAYVTMFPQLVAGPIVRYAEVSEALSHRQHSWQEAAEGLFRFLVGLGKKVILADSFAALTSAYRSSGEPSVLFCWLYAIANALNIYFDFSGYSDMAIGLGRILGFRFPENFRYPYTARTITDFWRRWHISLSQWLRDYVYIPLGGNRVSKWKWVRNILVVWLLTGLWHGAAWNFVVWGLMFAALLLAEKWIPFIRRLPKLLGHGYVLTAVLVSFVIFQGSDLRQGLQDLKGLFGLAGLPLVSREAVYFLRSFAPLLIAGILGSTPLVRNAAARLQDRPLGQLLRPMAAVALLLCSTAYLVEGTFSPFLYFRF